MITEIDDGLDLLWRSNIPSSQVVIGLGFYGRSFTLEDPSCTEPKCPFSGGAEPGACMKTSGVLSNAEIREVLDSTGATPQLDRRAGVKWISWDGQWYVQAVAEKFPNREGLAKLNRSRP